MKLKLIAACLDFATYLFGFLALWLGCCWTENLSWTRFAISCAFFFGFGALAYGCGLASAIVHTEMERKAYVKQVVRRIKQQQRKKGER